MDLHELAAVAVDVEGAHGHEPADAVLDVNDRIAGCKVAEIGPEGVAVEAAPAPSDTGAAEDLDVGAEPELLLGKAKPG